MFPFGLKTSYYSKILEVLMNYMTFPSYTTFAVNYFWNILGICQSLSSKAESDCVPQRKRNYFTEFVSFWVCPQLWATNQFQKTNWVNAQRGYNSWTPTDSCVDWLSALKIRSFSFQNCVYFFETSEFKSEAKVWKIITNTVIYWFNWFVWRTNSSNVKKFCFQAIHCENIFIDYFCEHILTEYRNSYQDYIGFIRKEWRTHFQLSRSFWWSSLSLLWYWC